MTTTLLSCEAMQAIVDRSPFNRWLGMQVLALDAQGLQLKIRWREELVSSPERQSTHGGVIAALVDCAADYVIAATVGHALPTLDLHIDYHRVARPGDLYAQSRLTHLGGTLGVAQTQVSDAQGRLIASGRGMYLLTPPVAAAAQPALS